jgi:hypothetical protein
MDSAVDNRAPEGAARWPNRRRTRRLAALGILTAGALAFAWLVWPTPYRYGRDQDRHRVNRFNGKSQVYDKRKDEWRTVRRGGSNGDGTGRAGGPGGGSPIGGSRSGGGGYDGSGSGGGSPIGGSRSGRGGGRGSDQWWYQDGKKSSRDPDESPIGGSREPAEKGSPIGGQ